MGAPLKGFRLEDKPRANGYWYFRGPKIQPTTTGEKDRRAAEKFLAKFILELGNATDADPDHKTIGWCYDYYDRNHIELAVKAKYKVRTNLTMTCDFLGRDTLVTPGTLNQETLNNFWRWRLKQPNGRGGTIKASTIRQDMFNFITMLNYAVNSGKLDSRCVPKKVQYPEKGSPRQRYLTWQELEMILEEARHTRGGTLRLPVQYLLVVLLISTGRRRRTVETLLWKQVDFHAGVIRFLKDGETESSKVQGTVPISSFLRPILEQAKAEAKTPYVMGSPRYRGATFTRMVQRLGLQDVVPHTLRHTFGSWLAHKGYSIPEIAHAMDCTEETASRNYVHFADAHKRAAVEAVVPPTLKTHVNPTPKLFLVDRSIKPKTKQKAAARSL